MAEKYVPSFTLTPHYSLSPTPSPVTTRRVIKAECGSECCFVRDARSLTDLRLHWCPSPYFQMFQNGGGNSCTLCVCVAWCFVTDVTWSVTLRLSVCVVLSCDVPGKYEDDLTLGGAYVTLLTTSAGATAVTSQTVLTPGHG